MAGAVGKLAALGAAAGGVADQVTAALDSEALGDKLAAQLGAVGPDAERLGDTAGRLYAKGYGTGLDQVTEAVRAVVQNIDGLASAAPADLDRIAAKATTTAQIWDQDLGGVTRAVGQLLRVGLVSSADEAFDVITRGFQRGADKSGDFLDTLNEYGTQFRDLGLDATTATGLLSQGLTAGARDADKVADALKEFAIRAKDGSAVTADGFRAIGLSAADMAAKFAKGGPEAAAALDLTLDRLRAMPDPVRRSQTAVALFGTQAEDLQQALYALDPSTAASALGTVAGAADEAATTFRDNAQTRLDSFWRSLQDGAINVIGGKVIPIVERVASVAATVLGPACTAVGNVLNSAIIPAFQKAAQWISANRGPIEFVAGAIVAMLLPALVSMGVQSTVTAVKSLILWTTTKASALGSLLAQSAQIVLFVAKMTWMGAQSLIQAAKVAAAWVLAMGPVGWIITAVVGLVALIVANWETVKQWTADAWNAVWGFVKNAAEFIWNLFLNWTLPGLIIKHWDTIVAVFQAALHKVIAVFDWLGELPGKIGAFFRNAKDAAVGKLVELIDWAKGLPGRVVSAIGDIGSNLVSVGMDIVRGIVRGLGNAASWIKDKLLELARNAWNAVLDFFGIASPAKQGIWAGRMIGLGLARGILAMTGTVAGAADALAESAAYAVPDVSLSLATDQTDAHQQLPHRAPTDPAGWGSGTRPPGPPGDGAPGAAPTVTVNVSTDADPHAIGAAVAWSLRTGGR
ncbi:phage-related minor tail protein [Actinokineospora baliensis]|uniref:phage tail tape measure protein n=1 Tax=Actinokineospora baliensis TaxID=547056 RepID=UPI0019591BF8|nr:phage tail tape measure protein [Actinokineospora baliensis]MBM7770626.1 phage-related minor tail protein [Actinokineospora baliensis]